VRNLASWSRQPCPGCQIRNLSWRDRVFGLGLSVGGRDPTWCLGWGRGRVALIPWTFSACKQRRRCSPGEENAYGRLDSHCQPPLQITDSSTPYASWLSGQIAVHRNRSGTALHFLDLCILRTTRSQSSLESARLWCHPVSTQKSYQASCYTSHGRLQDPSVAVTLEYFLLGTPPEVPTANCEISCRCSPKLEVPD